jgi:hypothetical protein
MKNSLTRSSELSSEVKNLLYRIEQSSTGWRVSEAPALPARTLRRWCKTDEEFRAARSLASELGIRLLD